MDSFVLGTADYVVPNTEASAIYADLTITTDTANILTLSKQSTSSWINNDSFTVNQNREYYIEINAEFQDSQGDSDCVVKFLTGTTGSVIMQGITPPQGNNLDHEISVKMQGVFALDGDFVYTCRFFRISGANSPRLMNVNTLLFKFGVLILLSYIYSKQISYHI